MTSLVEIGQWFWGRRFLNFVCVLFSLLRKALHLITIESSLPKDTFCPVWLKLAIGPSILEKMFKFHQSIFAISLLYPLRKERGPLFVQTWIPINKGWIMPSLIEIVPIVLEKKMKMWKDDNDDDRLGQISIRKAHLLKCRHRKI